jgi:probable phosphoglycerate mutase
MEQTLFAAIPGATEVLLIRHGQQEARPDGPVGLTVDPPLSALGRSQAAHLGRAFSAMPMDAVFSSPLRRARETAASLAEHHGIEALVCEGLREIDVWRDIPEDHTPQQFLGAEALTLALSRLQEERVWSALPHSEPVEAFRARVNEAMESIIANAPGRRIAIVCHAGVINAFVSQVLRSPYDLIFRAAHTSVTTVSAGGERRLVSALNDTHHLSEGLENLVSY